MSAVLLEYMHMHAGSRQLIPPGMARRTSAAICKLMYAGSMITERVQKPVKVLE